MPRVARMVPEDRLTAEPALTLRDGSLVKVTSDNQDPSSLRAFIKDSDEPCEDGQCNIKTEHPETRDREIDKMSETLTRSKQHLWLSAEPQHYVSNTVPRVSEHCESEVIIRSPTNITLDVNIRISGKAPKSDFNITLSASKCSLLSDLRAHIVATGSHDAKLQNATLCTDESLLCLIGDLNKVTFRLEEDGHIARLNITPTKIDTYCVFPETEYEAWYYRNVLRGKQRVYAVEVNIEA